MKRIPHASRALRSVHGSHRQKEGDADDRAQHHDDCEVDSCPPAACPIPILITSATLARALQTVLRNYIQALQRVVLFCNLSFNFMINFNARAAFSCSMEPFLILVFNLSAPGPSFSELISKGNLKAQCNELQGYTAEFGFAQVCSSKLLPLIIKHHQDLYGRSKLQCRCWLKINPSLITKASRQ